MTFITVRKAAARLGRDERTIRRWIENGTLAASESVNHHLIIDEAEIERLAGELEKLAGNDQAQRVDELAALVARVDALEAGQARLEQELRAIQTTLATRPFKQIAARQSSAPVLTSQHTENVTQADGLEIATVFAARHFPGESGERVGKILQTLRENGSVPMVAGNFKIGKATAKWALDAAGREAFYQVTHERDGFQPCLECPHEPAQEE